MSTMERGPATRTRCSPLSGPGPGGAHLDANGLPGENLEQRSIERGARRPGGKPGAAPMRAKVEGGDDELNHVLAPYALAGQDPAAAGRQVDENQRRRPAGYDQRR